MSNTNNRAGSFMDPPVAARAPATARPPGPPPESTSAQRAAWQKVRDGMVEGFPGYAGRPEYSPHDPAVLDPLIQAVLDEQLGGILPTDANSLRNVTLSSRARYIDFLQSAAGLALTERLVKERYAAPVVTESATQATLDFGVLPGRLQVSRGGINFAGSDLREGSEWRSTEVGRLLQGALTRFPKATTITLQVEIPVGTSSRSYRYSYDRSTDRVTVQLDSQSPYVSAPLGHDLAAVVRGERSLQTNQLPPR